MQQWKRRASNRLYCHKQWVCKYTGTWTCCFVFLGVNFFHCLFSLSLLNRWQAYLICNLVGSHSDVFYCHVGHLAGVQVCLSSCGLKFHALGSEGKGQSLEGIQTHTNKDAHRKSFPMEIYHLESKGILSSLLSLTFIKKISLMWNFRKDYKLGHHWLSFRSSGLFTWQWCQVKHFILAVHWH